jgi:hypothetical protein
MHEVYSKSDYPTALAFRNKMAEACMTDYEELKKRACQF